MPRTEIRAPRSRSVSRGATPRRVVMLTYPDAQVLDVTGPLEVFAIASRGQARAGGRGYRLEIAAARRGAVTMSSGLRLVADAAYDELRGDIDTLLVSGGDGVRRSI